MHNNSISSSPRSRRSFRSTLCRGCCTNSTDVAVAEADRMRTPHKSPYTWLKSMAQELEVKGRCRSLMARMGGRKHQSADFSYDPLSYALNFEDESEFHPRFASRLGTSPVRSRKGSFVADTNERVRVF